MSISAPMRAVDMIELLYANGRGLPLTIYNLGRGVPWRAIAPHPTH